MKTIFNICICLCSMMLISLQLQAQKAGIHSLRIQVDEVFQNYSTVEEDGWFSSVEYSEFLEIPDEILDSMKTTTLHMLSEYTEADVELAYTTNKKGRRIMTTGEGELLMGMPTSRLSTAIKQSNYMQYIQIDAHIKDGSLIKTDPSESDYASAKPMIELEIKFYDPDKKLMEKKKTKLKNFGKVNQRSSVVNGRSKSQILSPEKIFYMYRMAIKSALLSS